MTPCSFCGSVESTRPFDSNSGLHFCNLSHFKQYYESRSRERTDERSTLTSEEVAQENQQDKIFEQNLDWPRGEDSEQVKFQKLEKIKRIVESRITTLVSLREKLSISEINHKKILLRAAREQEPIRVAKADEIEKEEKKVRSQDRALVTMIKGFKKKNLSDEWILSTAKQLTGGKYSEAEIMEVIKES